MNTVEMKLRKSELVEIRQKLAVCSHCGTVFIKTDGEVVCEPCVKEAMEAEGFRYQSVVVNVQEQANDVT